MTIIVERDYQGKHEERQVEVKETATHYAELPVGPGSRKWNKLTGDQVGGDRMGRAAVAGVR